MQRGETGISERCQEATGAEKKIKRRNGKAQEARTGDGDDDGDDDQRRRMDEVWRSDDAYIEQRSDELKSYCWWANPSRV